MAPEGTPIYASMRGRLTYGTQSMAGRYFELTNRRGDQIFGAHLQRFAPGIQSGQMVRPGQLIGFVGNTGNAINTPPHLHWEWQPGGNSINPEPLIRRLYRMWYRRNRR